jgi:Uncharacterized protein encoded in hypervariable junctions of pilus gene clusters
MVGSQWGEAEKCNDILGGYKAVIAYDPDIEMFRGEFIGLNGSADFSAEDAESLKHDGNLPTRFIIYLYPLP